jgi:hypothetical protein
MLSIFHFAISLGRIMVIARRLAKTIGKGPEELMRSAPDRRV